MTRLNTQITLFLFLFILSTCFAQNSNKTDSLLNVYNSTQPDSCRILALNSLFTEYRYSDNGLAEKYLGLSLSLASQPNNSKALAGVLYNKGVYESEHGNFDSSDKYINKSLSEYSRSHDDAGTARCKMAFGFNCYDQGDFAKALNYFIEGARYHEKSGNRKSLGGAYIWIGNVYNNGLYKPEIALTYYDKARAIQEQDKDEGNLSSTYNNLGNVYYFLKKYDLALDFFAKSASLKEKLGNRRGLSATYNNIGNVYCDKKNYPEALSYYEKSLEIRKEFGDKKGELTSHLNIGNVYLKLKKYNEAKPILSLALEQAELIGDKEGIKESAMSLSYIHEALGDEKTALTYFKYASKTNDSLVSKDFNERMAEKQVKYDTEKKDIELARTNAELEVKEKQAFIKNIIIVAVLLLMLLLVVAGINFYRKKQLQQKLLLDQELSRQKDIRAKAIIEAEEKERIRIAKDLHDGVGQLLSAAKMNLSSVQNQLTYSNTEQQTVFNNAIELVDESVKEVRTVSHNMMPNTLLKMGLASAIKEFVTKIQNTPNLKVNLEIVGLTGRLEPEMESILYRVMQEVVSNIIKHAKATQLTMQMIKHDKELNILIEDNGVGFDTNKLNSFEGIGIKNILSRVEFIGGSVHFDSTPGKGTTVIIDVHLL